MLHILQLIGSWIIANYQLLLVLAGGAAGLSTIAQYILHKVKTRWNVQSKIFSYVVVQILTVGASLGAYLVYGTNFTEVYPWLGTVVAALHRFMISPIYTHYVMPYLEYLGQSDATAPVQTQLQPQNDPVQAPAAPAPAGFVG